MCPNGYGVTCESLELEPPNAHEERRGSSAAKPSSPMLRDEAADYLLSRLEDAPRAELRVYCDHGQYRAIYESWAGEWVPNLTDALASLIERLP